MLSLNHFFLVGLLDLIMEGTSSARVVVLLIDEKNQVVFQEMRENGHSKKGSISQDVINKALDVKQPIITTHPDDSVRRGGFGKKRSIICLPLIIEERSAGVLYLDRKVISGTFTHDDLELLMSLSKPINRILKNKEEFKNLGLEKARTPEYFVRGKSEAFKRIQTLISRVKDSDVPVFICGESGTGKELVARTIHSYGERKNGEFVAVNCGAIPEHLMESELFGYVRGAFTGAVKNKPGIIEEANGGHSLWMKYVTCLSFFKPNFSVFFRRRKSGESVKTGHYLSMEDLSAQPIRISKEKSSSAISVKICITGSRS